MCTKKVMKRNVKNVKSYFHVIFFAKHTRDSYYECLQVLENFRLRTKDIISFTEIFNLIFCSRCAVPTTD